MKTATVRQVRHDFGTVMQWVADGESVEVSKRGEIIALIWPPLAKRLRKKKRPDFLGRLKRIYGQWPRGKNPVIEDRHSRNY